MRSKKCGHISPLLQILWGGGMAPLPPPPSFYTPGYGKSYSYGYDYGCGYSYSIGNSYIYGVWL